MFENVNFCGTFRSYQQKVLDGADKYLSDGRINIVAAPGSGKTVLGLELIRRLSKPCVILSPTTTIRDQWGQRFEESFLPQGENISDYISYDLHDCKKITSITYQALYSAVERVKCADGEEVDCSDLDIFKTVQSAGVETLCLDEAHHLQNEWQRALEKFVQALNGKIKIISLTATPPYDANAGEWNRYVSVCGEIDEEIFVPELVKQGTLCPHQDYVWFNYPSEKETEDFKDYSNRVQEALSRLKEGRELYYACENLNYRSADLNGWLENSYKEVCACLNLFRSYSLELDAELSKYVKIKNFKKPNLEETEQALNFILKQESLLDSVQRERLLEVFKSRQLTERDKIVLTLNDKLKKKLISSSGKLESIAEITKLESRNLGRDLRLLVLTDYIRKEDLSLIGKDKKLDEVSVVSVFEVLRKSCPNPCGAVSGSLVILPVNCAESLAYMGVNCTLKPIENTEYAVFNIRGGNKEKVNCIGELFARGEICALVGTKSLLGEGWDSPCINTLILASFVGSFMLSNQMRGRAIRTDKNNPEKTANIWHLVTVEPDGLGGKEELTSYDFKLLQRRFNCFVAPSYTTDRIESGVSRLTVIQPPYDKNGVERINREMREISSDREGLKTKWENSLAVSSEIYQVSAVPEKNSIPAFTFFNFARLGLLISLLGLVMFAVCYSFYVFASETVHWVVGIIGAICIFILLDFLFNLVINKLLKHSNPKKSIERLSNAMLDTMKECGLINSDCSVSVSSNEIGSAINVKLKGAVMREQKLFSSAVADLFSPAECPRYLLIPREHGILRYRNALACPTVLGNKQDVARTFAKNLKKSLGKIELVYTRNERGRKILKHCRKTSYISENSREVEEAFGNY
ncbi:MAG: DEAD/DEAH box helicase family protein [Clostridia bacterium]|nr:DEAD/DEAH box helicase family protein [Clostridia bacterium]